jgi:uncharacterized membrane protein
LIRFINPNYHVILIHYPLALLGLGILIEMFGFLWPKGSLRSAGRWMILLGAFSTIPAVTSGIFAKYDAVQRAAVDQDNWQAIKTSAKLSALQWQFLNQHVLFASIGAGLATLVAIIWLSSSAPWPSRLHPLGLLLFLASMGLMTLGAHNSGEMIYTTQFGTISQDEFEKLQADQKAQMDAASPKEKIEHRLDYYVDPLQAHVIGAGMVFALAAAGLGVSMKRAAQLRKVPPLVREEDAKLEGTPPSKLPVTHFWIVTAVLAFGTLVAGWYVWAHDFEIPLWHVRSVFLSQIWEPYVKDATNNSRLPAHLILGTGIVVLSVLLIPLAKWSGRSRAPIALFGLLMIAMAAAQIWIGTLMMYDNDSGPLTQFNSTPTPAVNPTTNPVVQQDAHAVEASGS